MEFDQCLSPISPSWNINWIGDDILILVSQRLPIQTFGRFRCVCKSWNSLISSPSFAAGHHANTASAATDRKAPYLLKHVDCLVYYPRRHPNRRVRRVHFPFVHFTGEFDPFETSPRAVPQGGTFMLATEMLKYSGMVSVLLVCSSWEPRVELWAMVEYGVAASWRKLVSVVQHIDLDDHVIMMSEDGKIGEYTLGDLNDTFNPDKGCEPLNGCVYEESMFLMEGIECKRYTQHDVVFF